MFGAGSLASAGRGSLPPLPTPTPKPAGFAHNERVAAALLPSLMILAGFDGGSMASILMVRPGPADPGAFVVALAA